MPFEPILINGKVHDEHLMGGVVGRLQSGDPLTDEQVGWVKNWVEELVRRRSLAAALKAGAGDCPACDGSGMDLSTCNARPCNCKTCDLAPNLRECEECETCQGTGGPVAVLPLVETTEPLPEEEPHA